MRFVSPRSIACHLLLAATSVAAFAQSPPSPGDASTLHVYVNRMQIPVLLLDSYRHPTKLVPASQFTVTLQGIPTFAPTRVRLEGDDPISLAILVDRSDPEEKMADMLPKASSALGTALHPGDHVEVYAMDGCKMRRFGTDEPVSAGHLATNLTAAAAMKPFKVSKEQPCPQPITPWEAMLYMTAQLQPRNGRRILMALTEGGHDGSKVQMDRLHKLLNDSGVALFAVKHGDEGFVTIPTRHDLDLRGHVQDDAAGIVWGYESLAMESELSGGMVLTTSLQGLPSTLRTVIARVRGRYILEFPRPGQLTPGGHEITVSIGKTRDFVRPAGMSVPVASAEELATDPTVEHGVNQPDTAAASAPPSQSGVAPVVPNPAPADAKPMPPADPLDITDETQRAASHTR